MSAMRLPLGANRLGREPSAWTLVDADDWDELNSYSWHLQKGTGYAARNERRPDGTKRLVLMHRQLLGLVPGDGLQCDHMNGDRLDNRRANLRVVTQAQNLQNVRPRAQSGIRGVRRRGRLWEARVCGVRVGSFASPEEADAAARAYRAEHLPFADPEVPIQSSIAA